MRDVGEQAVMRTEKGIDKAVAVCKRSGGGGTRGEIQTLSAVSVPLLSVIVY